ncbi:hypothetical protein L1987_53416 [Smallanthus sonchifolius]|uniref:Uncharacterized protein n=1 Tax=Smallanthus sonchifolius TaxID=185202 RepID=A0ACB9EX15_9ASTR|nr:hypothetical protein L1987_53416 [Smallanthus sonchifolius]
MDGHRLIALAAISTGIFLLLLFYLTRRFCHRSQSQQPIQRASSLQNGINKLHQQQNIFNHNSHNKRRTSYYVLRRGTSKHNPPLFNWSDNPSLVTDVVENGWSRFAFTNFVSSPSIQNKSILGYCGPAGDGKDSDMVEIGWEVCEGSADFVQKIRMNSGLGKVFPAAGPAAASVFKSALPLPGPALGNLTPFPQEAYFEITILPLQEGEIEDEIDQKTGVKKGEGEKIKLIQETVAGEKASSESLVHVTSKGVSTRGSFAKGEELKGGSGGKDIVEGKMEIGVVMSLGLAAGGSLPLKVPGSYPGSIGFNSDGSVYLEGVKLTTELECDEWGKVDKVIGCGYNPSQKKVYFTIDAKLVHEIYCTTEEFETPLYPILAANSSATVLVNFGQNVFKYTQANLHRTPNPCFIGQEAGSPILGFEDSRELFSMGRIDAHWLDRSTKRNVQYFGSVNRGMSDYDESSEGDLFEIVLDNNSRGRSPSMHF